jgi:hypothetical protein
MRDAADILLQLPRNPCHFPAIMIIRRSLCLAAAAAIAASLSSCAVKNSSGGSGLAAYQAYDLPAKLPTNPSNVRVKVSLSKQRTYVMEGNEVLMAMPVSVGTSSNPTPSGNFRIFNKDATRRANTHGYAYSGDQVRQTYLSKKPAGWSFKGTPMPYWVEFKSAYGFHTGWVKHQPCTHGKHRPFATGRCHSWKHSIAA